jgi:PAS domain S-box-containing protein
MLIDIRTVVFLSVMIFSACTLVILQLWRQNGRRYSGMAFIFADFCMQTLAFSLIVLRGAIPDWASIVLSNAASIAGSIAGYRGLLGFVNRKGRQFHNYLFLALFACVHVYFTYTRPSLEVRNLNVSVGLLYVCSQCFILLLFRVPASLRPQTFGLGLVFGGYCLLSLVRIGEFFSGRHLELDYFKSGLLTALILVCDLLLFFLLTISIVIMVNKRLLMEVRAQEEKFTKAFNSAPYAVILARLADGLVRDVNDSFVTMTGYGRSEVLGKRTKDLHIWEQGEDRDRVVDILKKGGLVHGIDLDFRKRNGEPIKGLFSAEVILIDGEENILSSIADITDRRIADERVKTLLAEKELILKEVHHRIKNNMSTIHSLLNLQAATMKDPLGVTALEDAGNRIHSMMLLYDKLYQSGGLGGISMSDYLPALVDEIVGNFPNSGIVRIEKRVEDFVIDEKKLQVVGIIANELLTNIMKYAFEGRAAGLIAVSAGLVGSRVTMAIQDDGTGFPAAVDFGHSSGFGLMLVEMMAQQLKGRVWLERGEGTRVVLEFDR